MSGRLFVNCQIGSSNQEDIVRVLETLAKSPVYVSNSENGWVSVYPENPFPDNYPELKRMTRELSLSLETTGFAFMVYYSNFLLYKLYDKGELIDEYNSHYNSLCLGDFYLLEEESKRKPNRGIIDWMRCLLLSWFAPNSDAIVPQAIRDRLQGKPDVLLKYCLPDPQLPAVADWFHTKEMSKDEQQKAKQALERQIKIDIGRAQGQPNFKYTAEQEKEDNELILRWRANIYEEDRLRLLARLLGIKEERACIGFLDIAENYLEEEDVSNFRFLEKFNK